MQLILPIFLVAAFAELYVLIEVGGEIGGLWTIVLIITTAVIGLNMLKLQGVSTLQRAQQAMNEGRAPAAEMLEGVILAIGGVMLLIPGFISDAFGFLCMMPFVRSMMVSGVVKRNPRSHYDTEFTNRDVYKDVKREPNEALRKPSTLEGEFKREDD